MIIGKILTALLTEQRLEKTEKVATKVAEVVGKTVKRIFLQER